MKVRIPIKTLSTLNQREHWRTRHKRTKAERMTAWMLTGSMPLPIPCVVTMTRGSAGTLDDDNLRGALKGIRDGIADRLGIDDADQRVKWEYAQAKTKRGEHWVDVEIQTPRMGGPDGDHR